MIVEYRQSAGLPSSDTDVRWHRVAPDFTPGTFSVATENSPTMEWLERCHRHSGRRVGDRVLKSRPRMLAQQNRWFCGLLPRTGCPPSDQIFVGPHPGETQSGASVDDIFNGNVVIAYENFRFSDFERDVRLHIFTPTGQEVADADGSSGPDDGEVHVSGAGRNAAFPDVAVTNGGTPEIDGDGQIVVAWQDNHRHCVQALHRRTCHPPWPADHNHRFVSGRGEPNRPKLRRSTTAASSSHGAGTSAPRATDRRTST